ncbi:oxidoreductase [Luteolibacter soli]|uniref:Oxidoreductase n=1 Tax=Luteolibacter soli TaxID=3135280 RepID=A0ABU9ASQ5_9BACT
MNSPDPTSSTASPLLGGNFTFPNTTLTVHRVGYGAMQLAGPGVFGPPRDHQAALAVLRRAVELGVNHIDTSDFYGPHVTNKLIREALHPYPENLVIVTKVGCERPADGSWQMARSREQLIEQVHGNLRNLGVDALDIVNMRMGGLEAPKDDPLEEQIAALADLKQQGLIKHIGLSHVTPWQLQQAQTMTEIVCVQNLYNLVNRADHAFIDSLAAQNIAYVPYFPLGGFSPIQSSGLNKIAESLGATPMQVALAWLLHRSPNILLIPGTSSVAHLEENLAAAEIDLSAKTLAELEAIAQG